MTDTDLGGADLWAQSVLRGQHNQLAMPELELNTSTHCGNCGNVAPASPCPTCKEAQ